MRTRIDRVGFKYGDVVIIEMLNIKDKYGKWKVKYRCKCGKVGVTTLQNLTSGHTTGCGCSKRDKRRTDENIIGSKVLYSQYKRGAKNRKIDFHLSLDEMVSIVTKNCFYCGIEPSNKYNWKSGVTGNLNGSFKYNGIDRIDNSKGYILDNCVPCCSKCNYAKRKMSYKEFMSWIESVYKYSILTKLDVCDTIRETSI